MIAIEFSDLISFEFRKRRYFVTHIIIYVVVCSIRCATCTIVVIHFQSKPLCAKSCLPCSQQGLPSNNTAYQRCCLSIFLEAGFNCMPRVSLLCSLLVRFCNRLILKVVCHVISLNELTKIDQNRDLINYPSIITYIVEVCDL